MIVCTRTSHRTMVVLKGMILRGRWEDGVHIRYLAINVGR
jgi:hypothetical protein